MMEPPPAARRLGIAARETRNAPVRFVAITRFQSSSEVSSTDPTAMAPALFTTTLRPPNCFAVAATASSVEAWLATSQRTASAFPPDDSISRATASSGGFLRPIRATWAPSRAKAKAQARPMPVPPPVISAIFPESRGIAEPRRSSNLRAGAANLASAEHAAQGT